MIRQTYQDEITKLVNEQAEGEADSGDRLKFYPGAVSTVMKGLTEEQLEDAKQKVILWNKEHPPRDVQRA